MELWREHTISAADPGKLHENEENNVGMRPKCYYVDPSLMVHTIFLQVYQSGNRQTTLIKQIPMVSIEVGNFYE